MYYPKVDYTPDDFQIEPILEKFLEVVGPAIGEMTSVTKDYIQRNMNVADTASSCAGALGGAYKSNNIGKAIKTYNKLSEGCKKIAQEGLQGKVVPILAGCSDLVNKIQELKQLQADAFNLIEKGNAAGAVEDYPTYNYCNNKLHEIKPQFDAKQKEALAKLAELQGMPSDIPDMEPTNGSLSYQPNISVAAQKGGASLNGQYQSYNMGNTSITSVQN